MFEFSMILAVNRNYFLKKHRLVDLCYGEVLCFLCCTEFIVKNYLHELRLHRVKMILHMSSSEFILH